MGQYRFLGMDHRWRGSPPLLFETMVFGGELDQSMNRYSTWEEAKAGHREIVEEVRAAVKASPSRAILKKILIDLAAATNSSHVVVLAPPGAP